ncbi:HDOD domain-containing protein [Paraglaciecola arctica]|uniref:HDOD domain-containing protein n=1 Tax=Paraglaciecola arctica TaxID=1128911 RepID=UPI001C07BEC7|nr:HDOD domain-containing protein [Paraglaciecola arctica]MBU3004069.1 HDOD domain-containing protein [Paraglaciecola arctica]
MSSINLSEITRIAGQSFALPDICVRIRSMLDDDQSDLEDIGRLIALDPSLSSKLLKLANSPLFRFESQIDSLAKAINIIGGEALYNLVMAETASSAFEHFSSDVIDLKRFWLQSIYAALVAKHLAKMVKIRGSERFFLLGLLHNLGELLVAVQAPNLAIDCSQYDKKTSPWKLQRQVLGFDYANCSAKLMEYWRLPSQLYIPVMDLHDENKALQNKDIAIIYTAVRASVAMTHDNLYSASQLITPLVLKYLKLDQEDLNDAVKFASMEADGVLGVMNPTLS